MQLFIQFFMYRDIEESDEESETETETETEAESEVTEQRNGYGTTRR